MSLVKRKKILEKADNVVGYFGILLMISLFCLIFLYPEFFSREFWLEILILFIAGISFSSIYVKYFTGSWTGSVNNELEVLRKIIRKWKEKYYPSLIYNSKYDDYILELEEIDRSIQSLVCIIKMNFYTFYCNKEVL